MCQAARRVPCEGPREREMNLGSGREEFVRLGKKSEVCAAMKTDTVDTNSFFSQTEFSDQSRIQTVNDV